MAEPGSTEEFREAFKAEVDRLKAWVEELQRLEARGELPVGGGPFRTTFGFTRLPTPGNAVEEAMFNAVVDVARRASGKQ
jgi:hypothetical protein